MKKNIIVLSVSFMMSSAVGGIFGMEQSSPEECPPGITEANGQGSELKLKSERECLTKQDLIRIIHNWGSLVKSEEESLCFQKRVKVLGLREKVAVLVTVIKAQLKLLCDCYPSSLYPLLDQLACELSSLQPVDRHALLFTAIALKNDTLLKSILKKGEIDWKAGSLFEISPMVFAVANHNITLVKALAAAGADVNEVVTQRSLLMLAAAYGFEDIYSFLSQREDIAFSIKDLDANGALLLANALTGGNRHIIAAVKAMVQKLEGAKTEDAQQ
jgi:hypothetical protein